MLCGLGVPKWDYHLSALCDPVFPSLFLCSFTYKLPVPVVSVSRFHPVFLVLSLQLFPFTWRVLEGPPAHDASSVTICTQIDNAFSFPRQNR